LPMPHRETNDVHIADDGSPCPNDGSARLPRQLIDFLQMINDELDRPMVPQSGLAH
jgi:hypothetical protein